MAIIELDRNECIGCGACTGICFEHWEMRDDGKTMLKGATDKGKGIYQLKIQDVGCNAQAEDACPVDAISIK